MSLIRSAVRRTPLALLACLLAALVLAGTAVAAPLSGSGRDTGDGDQDNGIGFDWQGAESAGRVKQSPDANDDCFVGGVKELAPSQWAFNTSAGGCTPGKSNLRVAYVSPESTPSTTFGHFAFFRNDTTGNTFLTFELNQSDTRWKNSTGTTIPCRSDGDVLLSFEVGGSSLTTSLYKWVGDGRGPEECRNGSAGTFVGSGTIASSRFQGAMNATAAITNFVNPETYRASFPANAFGEAAIDLPAVLASMGQSPCFGVVQMQVHSRSSSSISSAMIDATTPVPVLMQSCAITGTSYQDSNGNGSRDAEEPGIGGFRHYADLDRDGTFDAGEPSGVSDATGFYRILGVTGGSYEVRQVPRAGWRCSQPAPCVRSASLVTGGNSAGNDFGDIGPSTASGTVFEDADGDGIRDPGEPDLAGTELFVDYDGDGIKDAGEPSATSGPGGAWTISDVASGTFAVRAASRGGWTCSAPAPCATTHTFSSGSAVTGLVFGQYAGATISGTVFEDLDGNGAPRAAGDPGIGAVQVFLDADGDDTFDFGERQVTTDASGTYTLAGVAPGAYAVRVAPGAATWLCTRPGITAAACERPLTVTSGTTAGAQDFGFSRAATVSGTTFEDTDKDAIRDSGEALLAGFTYWVDYDDDNAKDAGEPEATTDAAGAYSITGIRAGSWILRSVPNGAYVCTKPTPCSYALVLASNGAVTAREFGQYVDRSVSGTVFNDTAPTGVARTAGEAGLEGWVVYADDGDGVKEAGEPTATTNSVGAYRLTGLGNGGYRIRMVARAGWTCSFPTTCEHSGSIGSGQSDSGKDFGVWGPSAIGGTLYEDSDGDGAAREPGEPALAGRVVYVDANNNGARETGELSAVSNAAGAYALPGLNPGSYTIRQELPATWTCSRPSPCAATVAVSSGDVTGKDFASYATATISGVVAEDPDADGTRADGAGLDQRVVFLDRDDDAMLDATEPQATTNASGAYTFGALTPGTYHVRQVIPGGWTASAPEGARTVTVASGAAATVGDFLSFTTGSITGSVFQDTDFDGTAREAEDTDLDGVLVYLDTDADAVKDAGEPETRSAASGAYAFTGLKPGTYRVRAVTSGNWACAYPAVCAHTATVASRSEAGGRDFGSYLGATVTGAVYEDADGTGTGREPEDLPLAGRRLYLDRDTDGNRDADEPTAQTDETGTYSFTGVVAQSWQLRLERPAGWTCDAPADCRRDLTLASGSTRADQDFAIHTGATISGHLHTDRDNDGGPQVFGENDQPSRTVFLDADHDGELDPTERSARTDDFGNYEFTNVALGAYDVRQVLPENWECAARVPCAWTGVRVTSRQLVTGKDFSSWTTASFSGTYFEDDNANGAFVEAGEPGLSGRTVYLDVNRNATLDAGEPAETTGAGGSYRFAGLAPGTYPVRSADQPADWTCSYPKSCAESITLEAAEHAQDVDFGAWTTGIVAGTLRDQDGVGRSGWTVYADTDDDKTHDATEPSAVTGDTGAYALELAPAAYAIRVAERPNWDCTAPSGCAHAVTVTSQDTVEADFAFAQVTGITGRIYEDVDGDRLRDAGEAGREGVQVYLDADDDGQLDGGDLVRTTDANGAYAFRVAAGTHAVRIVTPDGWLCLTTDCLLAVPVAGGETVSGQDFAVARPATVSGTAVVDTNADGSARQADDAPNTDMRLHLDADADGDVDAGEPIAQAGADGRYAFAGVAPGSYAIRALATGGWTCSLPKTCAWSVALRSGDTVTDRDFGAWLGASASGQVFDDRDGDGGHDADEPGRGNLDVWIDDDGEGDLDPGEPRTTTGADGGYAFAGVLTPGDRRVQVDPGANWSCAAPADCLHEVSLPSGGSASARDFATWAGAGIRGSVYDDADGNGSAREAGDAGLAADVWLDADHDGERDAGETVRADAATGEYAFSRLQPGTYVLRAEPDGRTCSRPATCERSVTVGSGSDLAGEDFGSFAPASVSGTVREDADADGTPAAGEPGAAGWLVHADLDGDGVRDDGEPTVTTDATGAYAFPGLEPGAVVVRLERRDGWTCSAECVSTLTLRSGEDRVRDFGAYRRATLTGRVLEDMDADSSAGTADRPLAGAVVYVDMNDDRSRDGDEPSATTDADGAYALATVPGSRTVRLVAPEGFTCSAPENCAHRRVVASHETVDGLHFAAWRPGRIAGRVLDDENGNGSMDPDESGLPGQRVYVDVDDDGAQEPGEPEATSAADGTWAIERLEPGPLQVRLRASNGRTCTAPASCRHDVRITSGATVARLDFASHEPKPAAPPAPAPAERWIAGVMFEDRDADGREHAPGEPSLAGWTVYADTNVNGRHDAGEPEVSTDAQGRYAFRGLAAGRHTLRFVAPSDKWVCSLPAGCARIVMLEADGGVDGQDFAAWRKARISGYKFEDADRDGSVREPGDKPLPGWTVYADLDRDGHLDPGEPWDVVDEHGRYGLTNLPLGTLLVREVPPAGTEHRCTFPAGNCTAEVRLASGDLDATADFGAVRGIRQAARRARVDTPASCQSARFTVTVRGDLARRVELRVDGRRRATAARASKGRYRFALDARHYRAGVHKVLAEVTFLDGSSKTVRATFYRCRPASPRYTG